MGPRGHSRDVVTARPVRRSARSSLGLGAGQDKWVWQGRLAGRGWLVGVAVRSWLRGAGAGALVRGCAGLAGRLAGRTCPVAHPRRGEMVPNAAPGWSSVPLCRAPHFDAVAPLLHNSTQGPSAPYLDAVALCSVSRRGAPLPVSRRSSPLLPYLGQPFASDAEHGMGAEGTPRRQRRRRPEGARRCGPAGEVRRRRGHARKVRDGVVPRREVRRRRGHVRNVRDGVVPGSSRGAGEGTPEGARRCGPAGAKYGAGEARPERPTRARPEGLRTMTDPREPGRQPPGGRRPSPQAGWGNVRHHRLPGTPRI